MPVFDQVEIARQQLETALSLYESKDDYISAITLAGAAEEILGKKLEGRDETNSLDAVKQSAAAMDEYLSSLETCGDRPEPVSEKVLVDRANRARNQLKHSIGGGGPVELVPETEARGMLTRAVDNFWRLERRLTPAMESFLHQIHGV